MVTGYQSIKFDIEKEEFYIEDLQGTEMHQIKTKLPLSAWRLVKEIDGLCAVVVQERVNDDLEEPMKFTYYKVPLKFAMKPDYKNRYLTKETQGGNDEQWQKTAKVYCRNLETLQSVEVQLPQNQEMALAVEYTVRRLKSSKVSKAELKKILLSGECIGIFRNLDLLERIVS